MANLEHDVAEQSPTRSSRPAQSRSSSLRRPCSCSRATASCRSTTRCGSSSPSYTTTRRRHHPPHAHHTSGLRDWGNIEWIGGWPRGTRVYTHAHVLDIIGRQRHLNFTPGTRWSYSNTNYNLAAIIVSRARESVCRLLAHAHLRAARHDAHVLARRLHPRREGPGGRLRAVRRTLRADMPFENVRQRRPADDGRRPAAVERELRGAASRRRRFRRRSCRPRGGWSAAPMSMRWDSSTRTTTG